MTEAHARNLSEEWQFFDIRWIGMGLSPHDDGSAQPEPDADGNVEFEVFLTLNTLFGVDDGGALFGVRTRLVADWGVGEAFADLATYFQWDGPDAYPDVTANQVAEFVKQSVYPIAYPYLRAELQTLTSKIGLGLNLPALASAIGDLDPNAVPRPSDLSASQAKLADDD